MAWADLLRSVFALEILLCACGGERRIIAAIDEGPVARPALPLEGRSASLALRQQPLAVSDLGLPAVVAAVAPARIDQGEFDISEIARLIRFPLD